VPVDSTSTLVTRFTPSSLQPQAARLVWVCTQPLTTTSLPRPFDAGRVYKRYIEIGRVVLLLEGEYKNKVCTSARVCVWVCLRAFLSSSAARVECETASPSVGGSHVVRERLPPETFHNSTLLATSSQCVAGHLTAPPSPMFLRGEDEDTC
jgi:hypothetical protein